MLQLHIQAGLEVNSTPIGNAVWGKRVFCSLHLSSLQFQMMMGCEIFSVFEDLEGMQVNQCSYSRKEFKMSDNIFPSGMDCLMHLASVPPPMPR